MDVPREALCDTSVVVRFVHDHEDAGQAAADLLLEAWIDDRADLFLLDLSIYEFVNAVVRGMQRGSDEAAADMETLFDLEFELVVCDRQLAVDTARTAVESGLSAYDSAFVAAARELRVPLITADRAIVERAPDVAMSLSSIGGES